MTSAETTRTLITAGRVLTGTGGRHLTDGAVLTDGPLIAAVGTRAEIEPLAGDDVRTFSLQDATLLPGLIDSHVHLVFDAGTDPVGVLDAHDDEELLAAMKERAWLSLDSGVTTVRDLGDRGRLALRVRDAVSRGETPGPRVVAATTPLTTKGGHCWFLGGECEGEAEIRSLVRCNAAAGADVIKVMATGGGLTRGGPPSWQAQFGARELAAVVDEARRAGLPVAAHAHGTAGIRAAVTAGVDTIEHCTWMTEDGLALDDDVLDEIIAKGIRVCPTVSPHWPMLPAVFGAERAEAMSAQVRTAAERGVRLIAGTDAGVQRAGFDGLVPSLGFYRHLGLPEARIIDMATGEAADALGLGDRVGRIAPGHRADLIAVHGDPLADLAALGDLALVMADGRPHRVPPAGA